MKKKCALLLFSLLAVTLTAAEKNIQFPSPDKKGGMPLNQALNQRRTERKYQNKALSLQQIGDLLWAANGVNRPNGKRTAPSAVNRQEIVLYYLTKEGAFEYCPQTHQAKKITSADLRKWAGVFQAPLYVVLAADLDKAVNRHYAVMDTGYVSQNIYLHCASAGLGTCAIGSFSRIKGSGKGRKLHDGLKLPKNMEILLTHSVGILPAQ